MNDSPSPSSSVPHGLLNECNTVTPVHRKILALCWAGWVFDFYDLILFTFLMMPIAAEYQFSNLQMSYVLGATLASTAVGGVIFGILADRFGRKPVLQWTIVTYSLGTVLSGLAGSFGLLMVFRVITGLGVGGEWGTGQTYIGETFPAKVRGRYCALMQTGAPIGIALASIVGGLIMPHIGWRACFFISVLPALMVLYIRRYLPESDVWMLRRRSAGRAGNSPFGPAMEGIRQFLRLFHPENRKFFLLGLVLAIFDMSAYWLTYSWMPGYLHKERHFTLTKSALWILVLQSGGFLGYFFFGFLADRFGRRPAYSLYSVIMALGLVMVTLFWDSIAMYPAIILVFMFLVGFGTGMFGGFGSLFSELFPTSVRNTAMGSAFNLARGIQFLTPVVISVIAVKYGLGGGISLAALFALLTGAWIWTFPETRGRKLYTGD
ncbi:MAG TPA: MFS transporter [Bacteroidales bacterium]|nr:MFS transporter [Bacteroidales bacterium]HPS63300.1 MFS transporter [Bacteroidales bacterium]